MKSTIMIWNNRRSPRPTSPSPPPDRLSDYHLSLMPRDRIFRRTLAAWSVHRSLTTSKWIATLTIRGRNTREKSRHVQCSFSSQREASKFCKAYAPPQLDNSKTCRLCQRVSTDRHCRNCGATVCDDCSTRWGFKMVPKTYSGTPALTVRVCQSCDWLSNAFCLALLEGRYHDALTLFDSGNVNLRTAFANIHREAMFPVHCAVIGGNIDLVKWLVDTHLCPISVVKDPRSGRIWSVQTSASRTLLDLAMAGSRPKIEILYYLVGKGLSATDVKDASLIPKTLEAVLKAGSIPPSISSGNATEDEEHPHVIPMVTDSCDETSISCIEDACCLCYERTMDCALTPCGHVVCCTECGEKLAECPLCKTRCSILRIFR